MFITAEFPWGCGLARRLGLMFVPDARSSSPGGGIEGIFTGLRRLACVSWVRADNKVGTMPLCTRSFLGLILASSVLCFILSYAS